MKCTQCWLDPVFKKEGGKGPDIKEAAYLITLNSTGQEIPVCKWHKEPTDKEAFE